MTHNEYTTTYHSLIVEAQKCADTLATIAASDMPAERKAVWNAYNVARRMECERQANELRMAYYGTLKHNIYE